MSQVRSGPHRRSRLAESLLRRGALAVLLLVAPLVATSCVPLFTEVGIRELGTPSPGAEEAFATPVRAYLMDGSIVVLPEGGVVSEGVMSGGGWRYPTTVADSVAFTRIATDSVVGVEVFTQQYVNEGATALGFLASLLGSALVALIPLIAGLL